MNEKQLPSSDKKDQHSRHHHNYPFVFPSSSSLGGTSALDNQQQLSMLGPAIRFDRASADSSVPAVPAASAASAASAVSGSGGNASLLWNERGQNNLSSLSSLSSLPSSSQFFGTQSYQYSKYHSSQQYNHLDKIIRTTTAEIAPQSHPQPPTPQKIMSQKQSFLSSTNYDDGKEIDESGTSNSISELLRAIVNVEQKLDSVTANTSDNNYNYNSDNDTNKMLLLLRLRLGTLADLMSTSCSPNAWYNRIQFRTMHGSNDCIVRIMSSKWGRTIASIQIVCCRIVQNSVIHHDTTNLYRNDWIERLNIILYISNAMQTFPFNIDIHASSCSALDNLVRTPSHIECFLRSSNGLGLKLLVTTLKRYPYNLEIQKRCTGLLSFIILSYHHQRSLVNTILSSGVLSAVAGTIAEYNNNPNSVTTSTPTNDNDDNNNQKYRYNTRTNKASYKNTDRTQQQAHTIHNMILHRASAASLLLMKSASLLSSSPSPSTKTAIPSVPRITAAKTTTTAKNDDHDDDDDDDHTVMDDVCNNDSILFIMDDDSDVEVNHDTDRDHPNNLFSTSTPPRPTTTWTPTKMTKTIRKQRLRLEKDDGEGDKPKSASPRTKRQRHIRFHDFDLN